MTILNLDQEQLDLLATQLCAERREAVQARKKQGLDTIWHKARKQYQGIESGTQSGSLENAEKGETLDSPMTIRQSKDPNEHQGSTVFVNITRPYTNAGTARVADILLPTAKMPFELKPTPVSDLETLRNTLENYPQVMQAMGQLAPELAQRMMTGAEEAKAAIEAAATIIKDWLEETDWAGAARMQVIEAGKVGSGVLKGPFPRSRPLSQDIEAFIQQIPMAFEDSLVGERIQSELKTLLAYTPAVECIKVENCFPDSECGTNIHSGKYFFERIPEVTRRQLKEHMDESGYDAKAIQKCLDEDPKIVGKENKGGKDKGKGPFELWVRTGMLELCGEDGKKEELGFQVTVLCNDRVIKSEKYWLPTPRIPYNILCWEPREDSWAGIGIPEHIETPQRGLNAAVRALMDNMGYAVGPQLLELEDAIEPIDGDWQIRPYKRWRVKIPTLPGADVMRDAKQALSFLEFESYLNEIMPIINYWLKMAEDTTGLSLLLQGQAVTEAVGVSQQLMSNATTNLRLIVKDWDSKVCHPVITAFYEWVQVYGPEAAKGDAVVKPLGSAALIVRELQQQALLQIGDKVLQPIFRISPAKWMAKFLEGFQIDISELEMSEEEYAELQAAQQEPDPKVTVAEIQERADKYEADLDHKIDQAKLAIEAAKEEQKGAIAELQANMNILREAMKGEVTLKTKQEGGPPAQAPLAAPTAPAAPPPEAVDQALDLLES